MGKALGRNVDPNGKELGLRKAELVIPVHSFMLWEVARARALTCDDWDKAFAGLRNVLRLETEEQGSNRVYEMLDGCLERLRECGFLRNMTDMEIQVDAPCPLYGDGGEGSPAKTQRRKEDGEVSEGEYERVVAERDELTAEVVRLTEETQRALKMLWSCGMLPSHYDSIEKAALGAMRMVEHLRDDLKNPPADVQELVLQRLGLLKRDPLGGVDAMDRNGLDGQRDAVPVDSNVEAVRAKLMDRARAGLLKYGVTTEREDLTLLDWLQHAQGEAMDHSVYLQKAMGMVAAWMDGRLVPGGAGDGAHAKAQIREAAKEEEIPRPRNPKKQMRMVVEMHPDCHTDRDLEPTPDGRDLYYSEYPEEGVLGIKFPCSEAISMELAALRIERLQDISVEDCKAEGIGPMDIVCPVGREPHPDAVKLAYRTAYRLLWEKLNGPGSWAENPWVWVIKLKDSFAGDKEEFHAKAQGHKEGEEVAK